MSGRLTFDDRTLLAAAAGVSLVLIGLTAALGPAAISSDVPTTYSAGSIGAKASYMLLEASRYSVGRWERPLRDLPDGTNPTLILAVPAEYPTPDVPTTIL